MARKYEDFDESEGVWRTVGGRKIFIRNGQDLASAMKESGKFSRVARHQNLYKETSEEKETETSKEKNTQQKENNDEPSNDKNYGYGKKTDKIKVYDEKEKTTNWQDQIKANNAKLEKDLQAFQEKHKNDMTNEKVQEEYYGMFRKNERANAKIKAEHNEPNDKYMNVDAYAGYKEKFNQTWGEDGQGEKTVSAKMYTNDEFMEHLEDANWHSERQALLYANLTNKELEYIKDRTKVSAWGVENLTGKEQVDKLIKEAKSQSANQSMNNAIREKADELRKNLDEYKKDARTSEIDNAKANAKINAEDFKKAADESDKVDLINMGDGKYLTIRKGETKEDVIRAYKEREKKYRENLEPEVSKNLRDPRRLWDRDLVDTYIEMNERGLFTGKDKDKFTRDMKDMEGKPLYRPDGIKSEKATSDTINNRIRQKAYQKYLKEHPNSKMTFNEFKDMYKQ